MELLMILLIGIYSVLFADGMISPIPLNVKVNQEKASLGKKLFFDPILSKDNSVACINCHNIYSGGADVTPASFGVEGKAGVLNSPTVLNSVFNVAQFWDGRAATLKDQAKGPMLNPVEMASEPSDVVAKLKSDPAYLKEFTKLYKDSITFDNVADAIAEYEKTLITPNSRFDQFLRGDLNALNDEEKEGYELFKNLGCVSCHNGINIGSNMFQKFGIFVDDATLGKHLGRYDVTKNPEDKYYFKVPTLRNVSKTAPYFHDGSAKTLDEAIAIMGRYQLGRVLDKDTIKKLNKFLHTLDAEPVEIK